MKTRIWTMVKRWLGRATCHRVVYVGAAMVHGALACGQMQDVSASWALAGLYGLMAAREIAKAGE